MQLAARTGAWSPSGAPLPYDEEVEYLDSTGMQWIDTGVLATDIISLDMSFTPLENTINYQAYISTVSNTDFVLGKLGRDIASCYFRYDKSKTLNATGLISTSAKNRMYISADRYWVVNGVNVGIVNAEVLGTIQETIWFGASETKSRNGPFRFYALTLYNHRGKIRDLVPVRVGSVGYMYDRVSGQLFRNAGTGAFIIGPDKTT